MPCLLFSQSAIDAIRMSQSDLRGTARFMSMAGAFGALGGDLSSLSQNPAGIGVYRSSELGLTLDVDFLQSKAYNNNSLNRFNLNNIGGVATLKLGLPAVPNLNFGFTYNKRASFDRKYSGTIHNLPVSLSNYIAGIANGYQLTEDDVAGEDGYDPYNPVGNRYVPWLPVMAYASYLIDPNVDKDGNTNWYGQYGNGTSGYGKFGVREKGSIDDYNIVIGGNISNVVYWGMNFGITSLDYRIESSWNENLKDAYVFNPEEGKGRVEQMDANWTLKDLYHMSGTGFNYQLGVIVKPIQELRLGFAFHTPTFYNLEQTMDYAYIDFNYPFKRGQGTADANGGMSAYDNVNFRTPWKIIASVAGVIGNSFILSFDYEWNGYKHMKYSNPDYDYYYPYDPGYDWGWDYDWGYDWDYMANAPKKAAKRTPGAPVSVSDPISNANSQIREIYRNSSTIRLGGEWRVTPNFSIRAGYSYSTSPVSDSARSAYIDAVGVRTNYTLDNDANFVTTGLGYRYKGFYADLAYVFKRQSSEYYAFSPDAGDIANSLVRQKLTFDTNRLALSIGIKF